MERKERGQPGRNRFLFLLPCSLMGWLMTGKKSEEVLLLLVLLC